MHLVPSNSGFMEIWWGVACVIARVNSVAHKGQEKTLVEKGNLRLNAGGEWTPRIEVLGDVGSGEGRLPGSGNILK